MRLVISHGQLRLGQAHDDLVFFHFDAEEVWLGILVFNLNLIVVTWAMTSLWGGCLEEDKSHSVPERSCVRSRMDASATSPYVKGNGQRFGSTSQS